MWTTFYIFSFCIPWTFFDRFPAYLTYTSTDNTLKYSPARPTRFSLSRLLSFCQPVLDESRTNWADCLRAIRKVWLEDFPAPTVPHIPHVYPTRYTSSQEAQDDRNQKGDTTFPPLSGRSFNRFSRILQVIGTHNGTFHCDEALAVYMLRQTSTYTDAGLPHRLVATLSAADAPIGQN